MLDLLELHAQLPKLLLPPRLLLSYILHQKTLEFSAACAGAAATAAEQLDNCWQSWADSSQCAAVQLDILQSTNCSVPGPAVAVINALVYQQLTLGSDSTACSAVEQCLMRAADLSATAEHTARATAAQHHAPEQAADQSGSKAYLCSADADLLVLFGPQMPIPNVYGLSIFDLVNFYEQLAYMAYGQRFSKPVPETGDWVILPGPDRGGTGSKVYGQLLDKPFCSSSPGSGSSSSVLGEYSIKVRVYSGRTTKEQHFNIQQVIEV